MCIVCASVSRPVNLPGPHDPAIALTKSTAHTRAHCVITGVFPRYGIGSAEDMRRILTTVAVLALAGESLAGAPETWNAALKRGDFPAAAMLLQRAVFEPAQGARGPDSAALKQLAQLYAEGKGVERDDVLACGLVRAHAAAAARGARLTATANRAMQALVEKYCGELPVADRASAFAAMSCPRIGLDRHAPIELETGWSIQFNDRSATIVKNGQSRDQALPGDLVCRAQVLLTRHSKIEPSGRGKVRHVIEQVTVQSAWRNGTLTLDLVWQLYEIRGLELDLAAVQRWQEPGSAWPAPPVPDAITRGVSFSAAAAGTIEYTIEDTPPRTGRIELRASR